MAILAEWSRGEDVRSLQDMLNLLVPEDVPLRVDGIFGPMTKERVVQFQTDANLDPDGIVGPLTARALVSAVLAATLKPSSA